MTILTIDIETLPTTDESVIAEIAASVKAPGQYKKPESIAEWMATEGQKEIKDAVSKTSFNALYGSIACICWAFDDGEIFSVDANSSGSEKQMLVDFYNLMPNVKYLGGNAEMDYIICGHNVAAFDLPFLKQRSIIHRVRPTKTFLRAMNAKPWDGCIADTMLMWSSDPHKRGSMDRLCKAFGIDGKGDFDGSMVASTWPVDPEKVISYCKDDISRTRQIYKRLTFQG